MPEVMMDAGERLGTCEGVRQFTPVTAKFFKTEALYPLTSPRPPSAPTIAAVSDLREKSEATMGPLVIRARGSSADPAISTVVPESLPESGMSQERESTPSLSIGDLPVEVQGKILDFLMGEVHSVNSSSTSLRGRNVASLMRHPRRKAISNLALVSRDWRELVQERIYRHVKIKGTRKGIAESEAYFVEHLHLTKHIRHIEFWVPVWGDKTSLEARTPGVIETNAGGSLWNQLPMNPANSTQPNNIMMTVNANDLLNIFSLSVYSATLSEIFRHIAAFFPAARIFTLEGGHCKKSNMIRHFPDVLFKDFTRPRELDRLPQIRTFAMRGAWNIMREYSHWMTIENALPNVQEWHCGYAKPRHEAYTTINTILLRLPSRLRHVNISLDGMYSKDSTASGLGSSYPHHICDRLGRIAPHLESLNFTGKLCSCFWDSARAAVKPHEEPRLSSLEIVVKSCCRQRVTNIDPKTGEEITDEIGGVMADGAGITNLVFIKAFERLTHATVQSLDRFPLLQHIRIRFIDLDSPCALLNPYFQISKGKCYGLWNEEILESLANSDRAKIHGLAFEELTDGLNHDSADGSLVSKASMTDLLTLVPPPSSNSNPASTGTGNPNLDADGAGNANHNTAAANPADNTNTNHGTGAATSAIAWGSAVYPKTKPKAIRSGIYRQLADTRAG